MTLTRLLFQLLPERLQTRMIGLEALGLVQPVAGGLRSLMVQIELRQVAVSVHLARSMSQATQQHVPLFQKRLPLFVNGLEL